MLDYLKNKLNDLDHLLDPNQESFDTLSREASESFNGTLFLSEESDMLSNPIFFVENINTELLRFDCKIEFTHFNIKKQTLFFYFGSVDGEHWNQGSISREKAEELLREIINTICKHYRLYVKD